MESRIKSGVCLAKVSYLAALPPASSVIIFIVGACAGMENAVRKQRTGQLIVACVAVVIAVVAVPGQIACLSPMGSEAICKVASTCLEDVRHNTSTTSVCVHALHCPVCSQVPSRGLVRSSTAAEPVLSASTPYFNLVGHHGIGG